MKKRYWFLIIIGLFLFFAIISDKKPAPIPPPFESRDVPKGFILWPINPDPQYSNALFQKAGEGMNIIGVQKGNPFEEPGPGEAPNENELLNVWLERAKAEGYKTYLALEPWNGDRSALDPLRGKITPLALITDTAWQNAFLDMVEVNVNRHKPDYFNPCVEANMWKEQVSASQWEEFRALYTEAYQRVKAISPNTKVFCSLQYDIIAGKFFYGGGSKWALLDDPDVALEHQDFLGISTYPHGNIRDDWFDGLRDRAHNLPPVFVAEMGWINSDPTYPMTLVSAQKQKELIKTLYLK